MTYSHKTPQNPSLSTPHTAQNRRVQDAAPAYASVSAPVYSSGSRVLTALVRILLWLVSMDAKFKPSGCVHNFEQSRAYKIALCAIIGLIALAPGSREQKTALLKSALSKASDKLARLKAHYITWRQRKCWMWSGGFMQAALAQVRNVYVAANDLVSYDALIPD